MTDEEVTTTSFAETGNDSVTYFNRSPIKWYTNSFSYMRWLLDISMGVTVRCGWTEVELQTQG